MVEGQQADPAMPQGSTVSPENAQQTPGDGIPLEAQSPLTQGANGGGYNLLYLAKRAANSLEDLDQMTKMMEHQKMRMRLARLGSTGVVSVFMSFSCVLIFDAAP